MEVVTIQVGDQVMGVDLQKVQAVVDLGPLTPIPFAPPGLGGAVNVRGDVVAVLDLDLLVVGQEGPARSGDPALLVSEGGTTVALRVDRVHAITTVDRHAVRPCGLDPALIHGQAMTSQGPVHLLSLPGVLTRIRQAMSEAFRSSTPPVDL